MNQGVFAYDMAPAKGCEARFCGEKEEQSELCKKWAPAKVCHSEAKAKFCGESEEQQNELCGDFLQKKSPQANVACDELVHSQGLEPWAR